jgi:hypothetical protein
MYIHLGWCALRSYYVGVSRLCVHGKGTFSVLGSQIPLRVKFDVDVGC